MKISIVLTEEDLKKMILDHLDDEGYSPTDNGKFRINEKVVSAGDHEGADVLKTIEFHIEVKR